MDKSCFIKVRSIGTQPGNPVSDLCVNTRNISDFGVAHEEMIKIGASAFIDFITGLRFYTVETMDELANAIREAEKLAIA